VLKTNKTSKFNKTKSFTIFLKKHKNTRKKTFTLAYLAIFKSTLLVQQENDILGYWIKKERDAKIQINTNNDIFTGKIVWLEKPKDEIDNGD
tara:strand:- start:964 stop:1239 length:276 start_codon:yes stop_codon:yes gene_type:complete